MTIHFKAAHHCNNLWKVFSMATLKAGDLAALISGSPRMAVESVEGDNVSLVWCNEGVIYRDTFDKILLKRWEVREGGNDRGGTEAASAVVIAAGVVVLAAETVVATAKVARQVGMANHARNRISEKIKLRSVLPLCPKGDFNMSKRAQPWPFLLCCQAME